MEIKKRICIVTTLWSSIDNWIKPFLNAYNQHDIDVSIVCNMDSEYENRLKEQYPFIHTHAINFPRGMNTIGSLKSIFKLIKYFTKEKFDLVQYSTPNASFYASVASKIARIHIRLYCQWGMVYVTKKGFLKLITETIERITCKCSTIVQPDSHGNLKFCREKGLYSDKKSMVIWNGSAKGIDLMAYDIEKKDQFADEIKSKYNIPDDSIVIGFVGRLGKEKGCNELFSAYRILKKKYPNLTLLFVGPIEKEESITTDLFEYFITESSIIKTNRVSDVAKHMAAMDLCVLPSYREGFGMSVVEASAMGVPVVATKYPGPSSAMRNGDTGIEIEIGSDQAIVDAVSYLLDNPDKGKEMGTAGRKFAKENFEQKQFIQKLIDNRLELLGIKL